MIPIDSVSGQPHQCPNSDFAMKKKDPELGKSVIEVVQDLQQRMMALEKMFEERMTKLEMSRWS
tara:strand:+ start:320 stop:511 length:192 start_codon:yes stop_codon:yes gene_type:complete